MKFPHAWPAALALTLCTALAISPADGLIFGKRVNEPTYEQLQHKHFQLDLMLMARDAATLDNRVMVTLGDEFSIVSYLPLMLTSMRLVDGGDTVDHLLVLTPNARAYDSCVKLHKYCILDKPWAYLHGRDDNRLVFGDKNFTALLWRKAELVAEILHGGVDVLALDMDIVFFRNPLSEHVLQYNDTSIQMLVQKEYPGDDQVVNIGMYFLRSSNATKHFMGEVLRRRDQWDQGVVNELLWTSTDPADIEFRLPWAHIPVSIGSSMCHMLPPSHHHMANLTDDFAEYLEQHGGLATFHCACWRYENLYSKADALQNVLGLYLLKKRENWGHHAHGRPSLL